MSPEAIIPEGKEGQTLEAMRDWILRRRDGKVSLSPAVIYSVEEGVVAALFQEGKKTILFYSPEYAQGLNEAGIVKFPKPAAEKDKGPIDPVLPENETRLNGSECVSDI